MSIETEGDDMLRLLAPLCAAVFWLAPATGRACINGTELVDPAVWQVAQAERLLSGGNAARALARAHAAAHTLRVAEEHQDIERRGRLLFERARVVMAVAVVRLQGRVNLDRGRIDPNATPKRRSANLAWAQRILEGAFAKRGTPLEDARVAEGLALDDARWREALARLRALVQRDLMPDAFAWSVLARLELRAGADDKMQYSYQQCRKRAGGRANRICGVLRASSS